MAVAPPVTIFVTARAAGSDGLLVARCPIEDCGKAAFFPRRRPAVGCKHLASACLEDWPGGAKKAKFAPIGESK